jgi:hypothetical protein
MIYAKLFENSSCEWNARIQTQWSLAFLATLNRASFIEGLLIFLVYMVYPLHCSSCQCVYCLDCHSSDRKLTQLNYILTGKRRRGRKDQKLQSRMKLLRNLMETFIPWGIRSAFCRGEFPWITELTVTSGLYWENIDHPHHRDIFGCSSCGVAFFRTKYPNYSWYWTDICICFFMYLQMYSLSPLVQKYMKRYVGTNVTRKLRNVAFLFCILVM